MTHVPDIQCPNCHVILTRAPASHFYISKRTHNQGKGVPFIINTSSNILSGMNEKPHPNAEEWMGFWVLRIYTLRQLLTIIEEVGNCLLREHDFTDVEDVSPYMIEIKNEF